MNLGGDFISVDELELAATDFVSDLSRVVFYHL